jgi:hypothetical protein
MYYFKNDGWVKNKNYTLPTEIKEDFEVLPWENMYDEFLKTPENYNFLK